MEEQNFDHKVASNGWVIAGFIFAFFGGLLGIIIGSNYAFSNYDKSTKSKGWAMLTIGVIMMVVWRAIASA